MVGNVPEWTIGLSWRSGWRYQDNKMKYNDTTLDALDVKNNRGTYVEKGGNFQVNEICRCAYRFELNARSFELDRQYKNSHNQPIYSFENIRGFRVVVSVPFR